MKLRDFVYSILALSTGVAWLLLAAGSQVGAPGSADKPNHGLAPTVEEQSPAFPSVAPAATNAGQALRPQGIVLTNRHGSPKASTTPVHPPGPGTVTSAANTNAIVLDLYWIGALRLNSYKVKSDGRTVTYEFRPSYRNQSRGETIPTQAAWKKFWQTMEEVQLWKWKGRYEAPEIDDGTVWGLEVKRGDQEVRSSGHNAYPTLDTAGETHGLPSETFLKYYRAVEELMGRKVWE